MRSREVCKVTGVTYRQLVYWIDRGLIAGQGPIGSGEIRFFTPAQVDRVIEIRDCMTRVISILEEAGLHHFARNLSGGYRYYLERAS